MNEGQPSAAHVRIRSIRESFALARDVQNGTDGDPIAAARRLAEIILSMADAMVAACSGQSMQEKIRDAAPLIVTGRMADPEAFEEARLLLSDAGAPPLLDDLPPAWSIPPEDFLKDPHAAGFGIGYEVGVAAAAAISKVVDDAVPVNLTAVVRNAMGLQGILASDDQAYAVVEAVLDALGYEPEVDDTEPAAEACGRVQEVKEVVRHVPRTPWAIDFAPVPAALHIDTLPDDVRAYYTKPMKEMIAGLDLHPGAVVHAIFIPELQLAKLPGAVVLEATHRERCKHAWDHQPDPAGWGPSTERPLAVWYPAILSPAAGPF